MLAAVCAAMFATTGVAQERFILDDADRWATQDDVDPASPAGQLAQAWKALADGRADRAADLATIWLDRHERDPLTPEAYLLRGDALVAQDELYKALFDYETIARVYPGSEVFVTALRRELDIAERFARGEKRKLWGMRIADASDEAQELMIRVQERLPDSQLGEEAHLELANFYFRTRQMSLAVDAYDLFLANYPASAHATRARRRLVYAYLASFKGPEFDPAGLIEARTRLEELKRIEPSADAEADALIVRIDESTAQKLLETALWNERIGDRIATEYIFRRLVRTYPRSIAAGEALRRMPNILAALPASVREAAAASEVYPSELFEPYGLAPVEPLVEPVAQSTADAGESTSIGDVQ
jgi:outer membrane protein assembly factor BamD (BamD/ComL family)